MKRLPFLDKLLYIINLVSAFLLLLSYLGPHISVKIFSFFSVINLGVPILVFVNIAFTIYWLLRRKKQFLLPLVILVVGYLVMQPFYKFNFLDSIQDESVGLSVMSFNTRGFNYNKTLPSDTIDEQIVSLVKNESPDIVCFQEFYYAKIRSKDFDQYKYKYVDFEYGVYDDKVIQAIYSKFPIVGKGDLDFPKSSNNATYVDILYKKDTIRVYNLHLQSLSIIPTVEAVTSEPSDRLYKRLTKSFDKQQEQATLFLEHSSNCSYKTIVCGDFNNNQYSNVYNTIKGDRLDTYLEKGKSFGRSYNFIGFPLRIDFLLVDPSFDVLSHKNYNIKLSDHYPVMVTLKLKGD